MQQSGQGERKRERDGEREKRKYGINKREMEKMMNCANSKESFCAVYHG
jgi:hypothetical protein